VSREVLELDFYPNRRVMETRADFGTCRRQTLGSRESEVGKSKTINNGGFDASCARTRVCLQATRKSLILLEDSPTTSALSFGSRLHLRRTHPSPSTRARDSARVKFSLCDVTGPMDGVMLRCGLPSFSASIRSFGVSGRRLSLEIPWLVFPSPHREKEGEIS
jgi:hypothetical protein